MKNMIVSVDLETHEKNQQRTHDKVEWGGTMRLDRNTGLLTEESVQRGQEYDEIKIPPGDAQFHTHPAECNDNVCALGVPSVNDLMGFADAATNHETLVHLIYSRDGVYSMLLTTQLRAALKYDPAYGTRWKRFARKKLCQFRRKNIVTESNYEVFREKWVQLAGSLGFDLKTFAPFQVPTFEILWNNSTIEGTPDIAALIGPRAFIELFN